MNITHDIDDFIARHRLPASFRQLIDEHYMPLVEWLLIRMRNKRPLFLGINGAQGTGKTTLADLLQLAITQAEDRRVAVLSIDDFYLTRAERQSRAETIHPLLATRGVPGTHDIQLLSDCVGRLSRLGADESLRLPRFDKAQDDRGSIDTWPVVVGPLDLIILEGWCVASMPQQSAALDEPINPLERDHDPSGTWRRFVNRQLEGDYARLFADLDYLFFLQAPDFEAIFRWRLEQEEKLAQKQAGNAPGLMNRDQVSEFLQYFERLTRANLAELPERADIVIELDENHNCARVRGI